MIRPEQSSSVSTLLGSASASAMNGRNVALGEVRRLGGRLLALEHRLRGEHHHRAVLLAERVLPQQVEVRRGRRRLGDDERLVGAHRQPALDPGRGVVGTLALVAVGEQQHDAGLLAPLGLAGGDELVDDGLGAVRRSRRTAPPRAPARRDGPRSSRTRSRGRRTPRAASRRRGTSPGSSVSALSGVHSWALTRSMMVANRDTKVPRRESWPARRTGRPSISSEPRARISPVPQSIGPSAIALRTALQLRHHLGVDGEALRRGDVGVGDPLHHLGA